MNMKKLIDILKQFDDERTKFLQSGENWDDDAVASCFYHCAEQILCNGYFLVNDEYIIDLGSIELYYHEENGPIKDLKMYHRNGQIPSNYEKRFTKYSSRLPIYYRNIADNNRTFPYFQIGSFNLHQSGVDVTFENGEENKQYRASFLIRSYRMIKKDEIGNNDIVYDPCSSHLYDDMYYAGLLFPSDRGSIKWIEYNKGGEIEQLVRKNISGRKWQFKRIGIEEIE